MTIDVKDMDYKTINERLRDETGGFELINCCGQRFIGAGMSNKKINIKGTPGNALGAYLNGAFITVDGNAQDAVGDTMNAGRITVHGNIGDAAGYAMRGGQIFVKGSAGYRAGIHMKAYREKSPQLIIGGSAGSFLGEYQAGGVILVLGLARGNRPIVSNFPCTGMHGGKMMLRCSPGEARLPEGLKVRSANDEDSAQLKKILLDYCEAFGYDINEVLDHDFTVIEPYTKDPYHQMYVEN
ncbi:MAG: glutamate synthase [Clostridia bacterium]|nr:glutamate synthase [Clostridia bacterium]MBR0135262.1 glutamate synthase [Clostridia bacterium]